MILKGMNVRCNCDLEYPNYPKDFYSGKVISIDSINETAFVKFTDTKGFANYYLIPESKSFSFKNIEHCRIRNNAIVIYDNKKCKVKSSYYDENTGYYNYYLVDERNELYNVDERFVEFSVDDGTLNPILQIANFEFQHPKFFLHHSIVSQYTQFINNSMYGFKEICGCKIYLKSYQLKTIMRCLQYPQCRYMIADEVGLGKTIESLSVLKVYLSSNNKKKIAIIVPKTLIDQWKTEMAFKFKLFEGDNINENTIYFYSYDQLDDIYQVSFDFIIVDEVHRILNDDDKYSKLLILSKNTFNVLLLSATPIQSKKDKYRKLLLLIRPDKYEKISESEFSNLIDIQSKLVRRVHDVNENINLLNEELSINCNSHSEETEEIFEEIYSRLNRIKNLIKNEVYDKMLNEINYEDDDFSISKIKTLLSFVCENYQLEKSIIRNRRIFDVDSNIRNLDKLIYNQTDLINSTEYSINKLLSEWIVENDLLNTKNYGLIIELVKRFFSSSSAFYSYLVTLEKFIDIPNSLIKLSKKWLNEDIDNIENIVNLIDDDKFTRMSTIINYLSNLSSKTKVILFTQYDETFELYEKVLKSFYMDTNCAFFNKKMDNDSLEMNVYKFQNDPNYNIMLSDETGGEGRNFQDADLLINIDIPWQANILEQRIGRLDRISRKPNFPVLSVVVYSKDTLESDLFEIWNSGLDIFKQSQNGLEIIMDEIDEKIEDAIKRDFKYGLTEIVPEIIDIINKLKMTIEKERLFDLTAYQNSNINTQIENTLKTFNKIESQLFKESMLAWASMTGFNGHYDGEFLQYSENSFSLASMSKTDYMPPDFKKIIDDKMNKMRTKISLLCGNKKFDSDSARFIRGTFNRTLAVSNDYIHFFAPGDEVYDSIIDNCINSYRGKSSAFIVASKYNWSGLIFNWKIEIDKNLLYKYNLSEKFINQYIGYLPLRGYVTVLNLNGDEVSDSDIIKEYRAIAKMNSDLVQNIGKRSSLKFSEFQNKYPKDKWKLIINNAYKEAKNKAYAKYKKHIKSIIDTIQYEILNEVSNQIALNIYYNLNNNVDEIKKQFDYIIDLLSNPNIELDSVCYIEMVNKNE